MHGKSSRPFFESKTFLKSVSSKLTKWQDSTELPEHFKLLMNLFLIRAIVYAQVPPSYSINKSLSFPTTFSGGLSLFSIFKVFSICFVTMKIKWLHSLTICSNQSWRLSIFSWVCNAGVTTLIFSPTSNSTSCSESVLNSSKVTIIALGSECSKQNINTKLSAFDAHIFRKSNKLTLDVRVFCHCD